MSGGERLIRRFLPPGDGFGFVAAVLALMLAAGAALAVDNPDRPDRLGQFETRCQAFERQVSAAASTLATVRALGDYRLFLDQELARAQADLSAALPSPALRDALARSQRNWVAFRDADFDFIRDAISPERQGSSAAVAAGQLRNLVLKSRVQELLGYLVAQ